MLQLDQMNMINSLSLRCETIMSDPYNPIILAVSIFLVLSFILYCKEKGESSTTNLVTVNSTLKTDTKGKGKDEQEKDPVNVTYINILTRKNVERRVLVDLDQASGERLRLLWPQASYFPRTVAVNGVMRNGLILPNEPRLPELSLQMRGPYSLHRTGILVSAINQNASSNFTVTTKNDALITTTITADGSTNNQGATRKSFIRRNED